LDKKEKVEVVIENKMKRLPDASQLITYQNKVAEINKSFEGCRFVLLSLFPMTEKPKPAEIKRWKEKSYKDLADALEEKVNELVTDKTAYCQKLINDYIGFIRNLDEIAKLIKIEDGDKESYPYTSAPIYEKLENARLHDFFLKAKYAQIAEMLYDELREHGWVVERAKKIIENKKDGVIYVSHGFDRSGGFVMVEIPAKGFAYAIQVQDDYYNRGCSNATSTYPRDIFGENEIEKAWVDFYGIVAPNMVHPNKEGKRYKKFEKEKQYSFRYRGVKISKANLFATVKQLIDKIVEDVEGCLEFIKSTPPQTPAIPRKA